jgi:hypothetical protein
MKLKSDLTGVKKKLLEKCYHAIRLAEDNWIKGAIPNEVDAEETCDIPQRISEIQIFCSSIGNDLRVNKVLCTDYDKF